MLYSVSYPLGLTRFRPLPHILTYDDFDHGLGGWMDLRPNHTEAGFTPRKSIFDKTRTPPISLSTASFGWAGTHGSMDGIYSLKLATRPAANRYEAVPMAGSVACSIKRLTNCRPRGHLQYEAWFTYTAEQDRFGVGEKDIRAFFFTLDIQDDEFRYMPSVRYVNSVNGTMVRRWQYARSTAESDREWTYGAENEWAKNGIDPQWYGKRCADGRTEGYQWIDAAEQSLCYNESDDKVNWMYFRMLIDLGKREYVEMECQGRTFDLRSLQPTLSKRYDGITGLLNPVMGIENDSNRSVYMYVDSVCLSAE